MTVKFREPVRDSRCMIFYQNFSDFDVRCVSDLQYTEIYRRQIYALIYGDVNIDTIDVEQSSKTRHTAEISPARENGNGNEVESRLIISIFATYKRRRRVRIASIGRERRDRIIPIGH